MTQIAGVLPDGGDTVFVGCDETYAIEHAVPLMYGLLRHNPDFNIHLHVYNLTPRCETLLRLVANDLKYQDIYEPAGKVTLTWEIVDLQRLEAMQRKTYYAAVRFVRLAEIMQASPGRYLCLDADSIVRKPIELPDADVGLFLRPENPIQMQIAAGAVFIQGHHGRAFIERTAQGIVQVINAGKIGWYMDQLALLDAYRNLAPEAKLYRFDQSFMSWDWHEDAPIWTGKGNRKHDAREYREAVLDLVAEVSPQDIRDRFWKIAA